jgi:hypothetical protein
MYAALEWDHDLAKHFVGWIVVECSSIDQLFGLPQALPPRRDIAYFVKNPSAEKDARAFAEMKNQPDNIQILSKYSPHLSDHHGFIHYAWDHNYLQELIKHAVLYWEDGHHDSDKPIRDDIAYFVHPDTSQNDSELFAQYKLNLIR